MRYTTFGRLTGLRVSQYALGTANFGTADSSAGALGSRQIFDAFVAAGGTTFDTSNIYQDGQAEIALGELLGTDRDDFVVITKYSGTRQSDPRPGTTGNSRKTMRRAIEASLRRLRTDHVDVFMPHFPDGTTPLEEILAGFDDLVRAGKILHGGLSNFPAWRVAGAVVRADLQGSGPAGRNRDRVQPGPTHRRQGVAAHGRSARTRRASVLPTGRRPAHRQVPPRRQWTAHRPRRWHRDRPAERGGRRRAQLSPTRPAPVPPRSRWPGFATAQHFRPPRSSRSSDHGHRPSSRST